MRNVGVTISMALLVSLAILFIVPSPTSGQM